jgi:adenylate cyclase
VTNADADAASAHALAALVALDSVLLPGEVRYTSKELAEVAGVDFDLADRLWRAMGFAAVSDDEPLFVDDDLAALRMATQALTKLVPQAAIVYQTRVMAAALSRVAEVASDNIVANIDELVRSGLTEKEITETVALPDARDIDHLVGYVYRRQLRAALWRKLGDPVHIGDRAMLTVGFVDLVRFTAVTEDIAEEQLAELIDRFESVVHDRVTVSGGRIVKMIGDEAMFVAEQADQATQIAIDLVSAFHLESSVPEARAGLACGSVLSHGGDYFGPVVNLASRIVDVARPSSVVVSQEVRDRLAGRPEFTWRRLPPKRLKGIGRTTLFAASLSAAGRIPGSAMTRRLSRSAPPS